MPMRTVVRVTGAGAVVVGTGAGAVVLGAGAGAVVVGDGAGAVVVGDGAGAVVVGDGAGAVVVGDGAGAVVVGDGFGAGAAGFRLKVTTSLGALLVLDSLDTSEALPEEVVSARPMVPEALTDLVMSSCTVFVEDLTATRARALPTVTFETLVTLRSDQLVCADSRLRVAGELLARFRTTLADESV
jgi:hypothetical protein